MKGKEKLAFSSRVTPFCGPRSSRDLLHYRSWPALFSKRQDCMHFPPQVAMIALPDSIKHDLTADYAIVETERMGATCICRSRCSGYGTRAHKNYATRWKLKERLQRTSVNIEGSSCA